MDLYKSTDLRTWWAGFERKLNLKRYFGPRSSHTDTLLNGTGSSSVERHSGGSE